MHLLEVLVTVDVFSLVGILQPMSLDVLPQRIDDDRSCLRVNAEQSSQAQVKLELHRLKPQCISSFEYVIIIIIIVRK